MELPSCLVSIDGKHVMQASVNYLFSSRESYGQHFNISADCTIFFIQLNKAYNKKLKVLPPYVNSLATRWHTGNPMDSYSISVILCKLNFWPQLKNFIMFTVIFEILKIYSSMSLVSIFKYAFRHSYRFCSLHFCT